MIGTHWETVDTDAHYLEQIDELSKYLDEKDPWKSRFRDVDSSTSLFSSSTGDQRMFGRISREDIDIPWPDEPMQPENIPAVMDYLDIDSILLLSHRMLSFARMRGDNLRHVSIANAYVDYMLDKVVNPREGIYTMVVAPYQEPEAAVDLIDRVADEKGVVGVCMIAAGAEPPLGHHRYEPIYEIAQDADLPVVFHTGGGGIDEFYIRGYETFLETHTLGFLWNNMAQLTSLIVQGVPEKYPDLDIIFQESGIFWVPLMMNRLDTEYLKRPSEAPILEKLPSEYMKEIYYGTQPLEDENTEHLEHVMDMLGGADRLMYASDYPHWDYDPPSSITDIPFLEESDKKKILGENAKEVFGI